MSTHIDLIQSFLGGGYPDIIGHGDVKLTKIK